MFTIAEVMSTDLVTVAPGSSLLEARSLMHKHRIHHLPVVEHDHQLVGLLTLTDVLASTDSRLRSDDSRIHAADICVSEVMVTDVAPVGSGFTPPYGFGLSVIPAAGEKAIWHTGVIAGYNSVLMYFPEQNVVIAAITNKRRALVSSVAKAMARAVMNLPDPVLEDRKVPPAVLDRVVGTYDDHLFIIRVFVESGQLYAHISDMDITFPLRYQGEGEFATDDPPGFRFWFKPMGERAEHVVFEWLEIHSFGRRIE